MRIDRRKLLNRTALAAFAGSMVWLAPSPSFALGQEEAVAHVRLTIGEVSALVDSPGNSDAKTPRLRAIMEQRAAMPQIARFAAGVAWRGMSEGQQARFTEAFSSFLSGIYAGRFQDYAGGGNSAESFSYDGVIDAGRKGLLVKTVIIRTGETPVNVEWLVTDQPGRAVIADIVIEGISMLVTQREEIGAMLEARGGDVEKLIAELKP